MSAPQQAHDKELADDLAAAEARETDLLARLATRGEDTLRRLQDLPGGRQATRAYNDLRHRVDELTKRVSGMDALEARMAKLEKEVATLKRQSKSAPRGTSATPAPERRPPST